LMKSKKLVITNIRKPYKYKMKGWYTLFGFIKKKVLVL